MKVTVKKLPKSQVELTITVPYTSYQAAEKIVLETLGKEIKVDGFRPGYVPAAIVRERLGEDGLRKATMEKLLPESYTQAVTQEKIDVIAPPEVHIKSPIQKTGDDLTYVAIVAVMPEVAVGNYKKIKVTRPKVEVTEKEVTETIETIMNRFAEWQDVKRAAKNEDRVEVDFEGFDESKKPIPNTAGKNHPLVLGSDTMVPGFEEAIIGMKINETKEFQVTFPKGYHAKAMRGQKVTFRLTLNRLEEKTPQKLDEAMVEKITGQKQSADDFKKRVETDLKIEMEHRARGQHDQNVVNEIIKITTVDLPPVLIHEEVKLMKEEKKAQVKRQGLTWEQYLQHIKKTDEDFEKEHQQGAEERLKARLGVLHIIKKTGITATEEDADKKITEMLQQCPESEHVKIKEYYKKESENYRSLLNNLAADKLITMLTK